MRADLVRCGLAVHFPTTCHKLVKGKKAADVSLFQRRSKIATYTSCKAARDNFCNEAVETTIFRTDRR